MTQPYELTIVKNSLSESDRRLLYESIDKITENEREWNKVDVLLKSEPYLEFLTTVTELKRSAISKFLEDYRSDDVFKKEFVPALQALGDIENAGDLRFHALTLYVIVRALNPQQVIETGVAQGKSSAILLLALHRNNAGHLTSIDLPNPEGKRLGDGSFTSTGQRDVGWMVPSYLRSRWDLVLGDAQIELPRVVKKIQAIDIFFHDSLHTYDHVKFEIETVHRKMNKGLIIIDNLETEAGKYFEEFVSAHSLKGFAFSNLGIIQVQHS